MKVGMVICKKTTSGMAGWKLISIERGGEGIWEWVGDYIYPPLSSNKTHLSFLIDFEKHWKLAGWKIDDVQLVENLMKKYGQK